MDYAFGTFKIIKALFVVFDLILVFLLFYILKNSVNFIPDISPRAQRKRGTTLSRTALRDQWSAIMDKFNEGTADAMKISIINADKFIDYILKEAGFSGDHMADRLEKLAPHGLSTFDRVWRAHRIRNQLVHSPEFEVPRSLAEKTLQDYEAFLREVRILH